MSDRDQSVLKSIAKDYAVANTALYLLRKIRENPMTGLVASRDGAELLRELQAALDKEAASLEDEVAPYLYLVALSLNRDQTFSRIAATLSAPHHRWYRNISAALHGDITDTRVTVKK